MRTLFALGPMFIFLLAASGCEEESAPPLTPLKPGLLRASTDSINFGTFPRGFSATQTITIVNNGQIAINFDAITLTGHNETFNLGDQPTSLGVKDNDIIEITFSPTTVGEFESQIQFEFDGENTPFIIDVFASSVDNPLCAPCDEAPTNYCIDDNILALYEKTLESCGEGMCLYVAQDVLCNIGCDRETGACISLDAGVNTGGSNNNNNNANDNDGGALPADNEVVADGGYNPDSQGTNDTENDGGTNAQATAAYQVAQANSTTCYTCSDWENPISCDVSEANCTSTQGIGYGQEYHYDNSHELAFLEIEGRLLKDTNTGLTWSRCANGSLNDPCDTNTQPQNFASATALCQQRAAYEGASFRLPSLGELLTLINYQSSLTVLGDADFMWPSGLYWTTDQVQPTNPLTNYWVINTVEQKLSENTVQDQAHVLCVSGITHGESGLLDQAGDIFDSRTQLLWQRCRYGQSLNSAGECIGAVIQLPFHDALAQCESRVTENGADWRLPSIRELTTMALYPETPDLTSEFGSAEEGLLGQLWSGTPHFTDTAIWVFNPTGPYWQKGGSSQPLRCVRSP